MLAKRFVTHPKVIGRWGKVAPYETRQVVNIGEVSLFLSTYMLNIPLVQFSGALTPNLHHESGIVSHTLMIPYQKISL